MIIQIPAYFKSRLDRLPLFIPAALLVLVYTIIYLNTVGKEEFRNIITGEFLFNSELLVYVLVGIGAQLIDGALGMAYGVSASSFLMSVGVHPAAASAAVHVSEVFTTGASGLSHLTLKNINVRLFKAMVMPGILGAIVGAYILSEIDGNTIKPFVSAYLLVMGVMIIAKAVGKKIEKQKVKHVGLLALVGGFLDSIGGGGWGPVVTSTLLNRGRNPKYIIGTVNATEFFVAFSSASIFTLFLGLQNIQVIAGLIIGGLVAAPFGALVVGKIKPRILMIMVGLLVVFLSIKNLVTYLSL